MTETKKSPILAVLAAGMGSRYGGLKQMEPVGKNGEALLDYSVYDALRHGFEKVVFIIREDIEKDFRAHVLARMGSNVKFELAFQNPDTLIPPDIFAAAQKAGRTKPWGTAHALICAADALDRPFAVINADDFYGRQAFEVLGGYLKNSAHEGESSLVPYSLEKTLSALGTVTRGVCEIKDGFLTGVDELGAIEKKGTRVFNTNLDGSTKDLAPDSPVSMNFWGFHPSILGAFKKYFEGFLEGFAADMHGQIKSECYIPKAADFFIKQKITKIRALEADSPWFGVTYKEDALLAVQKIEEMTVSGVYPSSLW